MIAMIRARLGQLGTAGVLLAASGVVSACSDTGAAAGNGGAAGVGGSGGSAAGQSGAGGSAGGSSGGSAGAGTGGVGAGGYGGFAGAATRKERQTAWADASGPTPMTVIHRMRELSNHDVVIAGSGLGSKNSAGKIVRVTPNNDVRWMHVYEGSEQQSFTDVIELPTGDLVVVGTRGDSRVSDSARAFVLRLRPDGSPVWARETTTAAALTGVALNQAGNLVIVGERGRLTEMRAVLIELTQAGADVRTLLLATPSQQSARAVGRGPGDDLLVALETEAGAGHAVVQLTSNGTVRSGWTLDGTFLDYEFSDAKLYTTTGPVVQVLDAGHRRPAKVPHRPQPRADPSNCSWH